MIELEWWEPQGVETKAKAAMLVNNESLHGAVCTSARAREL